MSSDKALSIEEAFAVVRDYFDGAADRLHLNGTTEVVKLTKQCALDALNVLEPVESRNYVTTLLKQTDHDPYAYDAAIEIATEVLRSQKSMPDYLAAWLADHLDGSRKKPRQRGKDKRTDYPRNFCILMALIRLRSGGVTMTRNDGSTTKSGCDIVSDVLLERGLPIGYDRVKDIWEHWRPIYDRERNFPTYRNRRIDKLH